MFNIYFRRVQGCLIYTSRWVYFKNTWRTLYNPTTWNVYDIINDLDSLDILGNRTNNPLERHNGELNSKMHAKPAMVEFVTTIKEVSNEKAFLYNEVKGGQVPKPTRPTSWLFVIPAAYNAFVIDQII